MSKREYPKLALAVFVLKLCLEVSNGKPAVKVCTDLLPEDYEMHKPSDAEGDAPNVFTWVQILDFGDINEANMDFLLHAFVIIIWNDTRLKVDRYKNSNIPTILYTGCRDYIWTPDIFYETAKDIKSEQNYLPSTLLKILPFGAVYLSTKYSFRARCPMDLKYYPFDTQTCIFKISLLSTDAISKLHWIGDPISPYSDEIASVEMLKDPHLLLFSFVEPTSYSITETYAEGNYTTLVIQFGLVRLLTGSILNMYIPSTLIVVMSWVGFWLGVDAVPARVALSVTSLLTLCTQVHQYRTQLPPVNYLKAMDVWLFICIFTVFLTLVEFAFSFNSKPQSLKGKSFEVSPMQIKQHINALSTHSLDSDRKKGPSIHSSASSKSGKRSNQKCNTTDGISRKVFPALFICFSIIYWCYYIRIYKNSS